MGTIEIGRRALLGTTAALIAARAKAQAATRLRLYWWGGVERAERTNKTAELYTKTHPTRGGSGNSDRAIGGFPA